MGGGGSKQKKEKPPKHQPAIGNDWELATRNADSAIYRDRNGREAQEYKYILNNRYDPAHQFDVYEQRRKSTIPVVKSYGAEFKSTGSGLVPKNQFRVLTQRIPHRLCTAPQLTYPESLYVLQESLIGYQTLYDKVGPFYVNSDMIGFTPEGETKVWFNENFGENYPSCERHVLQSTLEDRNYLNNLHYNCAVNQDEAALVRNIVEVVEDKCQEGRYPNENLRRQLYRERVGFEEARSIVRNAFTEGGFASINHIDFYNNYIQNGGGQHVVSHPQQRTTTHHESYVRPVQTHSHIDVHQPQVVSTGAHFSSSYRPMNTAKPNANYMFNYQQPKEYFHPDMYASRH